MTLVELISRADKNTEVTLFNNKDKIGLSDDEIDFVCSVIETHMGEWNKDFNGNEVLPVPKNKYQRFVHMCDFLAAKKFIDVPFTDNEIVG